MDEYTDGTPLPYSNGHYGPPSPVRVRTSTEHYTYTPTGTGLKGHYPDRIVRRIVRERDRLFAESVTLYGTLTTTLEENTTLHLQIQSLQNLLDHKNTQYANLSHDSHLVYSRLLALHESVNSQLIYYQNSLNNLMDRMVGNLNHRRAYLFGELTTLRDSIRNLRYSLNDMTFEDFPPPSFLPNLEEPIPAEPVNAVPPQNPDYEQENGAWDDILLDITANMNLNYPPLY